MAAFVEPPAVDAAAQALFDRDVEQIGFVMNASRVWSHQPDAVLRLFELLGDVRTEADLSMRDMGILIAATRVHPRGFVLLAGLGHEARRTQRRRHRGGRSHR